MKGYGGLFFLFVEPKHRDTLLGRIQRNSYFTFGVSSKDIHPELAEICLVSFDGESISHICLARKSKSAETGRTSLKFSRFLELGLIKLEAFKASPTLFALAMKLMSRQVSRVDSEGWNALVAAIKSIRPSLTDSIDALDKIRRSIGVQSNEEVFKTVA